MNGGPIEAAAWTLLIIAIMFLLGFGTLAVVDIVRMPRGQRGLALTSREKRTLLAMAAVTVPALIAELLLETFSPYLLLMVFLPLTVAAFAVSRRRRQRD